MATLYPYDINMALHVSAAVAADAVGSVAYYDVGGAYRFPAVACINVTACVGNDVDETYDVIIQGSTDSAFTTPVELGSMKIVRLLTGRYSILFDNDQNGTAYRYIRVYFDVGGTTPSITSDVWLAPLFPVAA
jgi:hypothetical protein